MYTQSNSVYQTASKGANTEFSYPQKEIKRDYD